MYKSNPLKSHWLTMYMNQLSFALTYDYFILQVETVNDYDEYCHYVAGLVGIGLSKLFHASGKEDLATDALSNSMGLFLQVLQNLLSIEQYNPQL